MRLSGVVLLLGGLAHAQSTGALVAVMVRDTITGAALSRAELVCTHLDTGRACTPERGAAGWFWLRSLTPGTYRIRAEVPPEQAPNGAMRRTHQAREAARIEIPVAGLIFLDFDLRPVNDLWEQGQYRSLLVPGERTSVSFYGPDVDLSRAGSFLPPERQENRLDASLSTVVQPLEVRNLPFASRDLFATLALQPMVTTSSTTARGLGLYANGQRATATNYLLDGVDANAYLTSGPQFVLPPEAAQEYRVSIANYTAEYGGASGLIANAVTLAGGRAWHGLGYGYLINEALNANDIAARYAGEPRAPYKQVEGGVQAGGPLWGERWSGSFLWDGLRSRGVSPCEQHVVPAGGAALAAATAGGAALAQALLTRFPVAADSGCRSLDVGPAVLCPLCSLVRTRPTETTERQTGVVRLDAGLRPGLRWMLRGTGALAGRPDYVSSPFPGLVSGLDQINLQMMTGLTWSTPRITHEFRAAYGADSLWFSRAAPEVPHLLASDVELPSSGLDAGFAHRGRSLPLVYQMSLTAGRHAFRAGAQWTQRTQTGLLDAGPGEYRFPRLEDFLRDQPSSYAVRLSRADAAGGALAMPDVRRRYRYRTGALFVHDSMQVSRRLTVSAGIRFEYFGAPRLEGPGRDVVIDLPANPDSEASLTAARARWGDLGASLYPSSRQLAFRTGAALALDGRGRTIVRGGAGTFFDRMFDNVWLNVQQNQYEAATAAFSQLRPNYLLSPAALLASFYAITPQADRVRLTPFVDSDHVTAFHPELRPARVTSVFGALEQVLARNWRLEVAGTWNRGDDLLVNDEVNRKVGARRAAPGLPPVFLRSSAGVSRAKAWSARLRWQGRGIAMQAAYTNAWSTDNQSDPLAGDFDVLRTQTQLRQAAPGYASFSQAFNGAADAGPSDWDQRHNVVLYAVVQVPAYWVDSRAARLFRDWTVSPVGAIRSGTPFSVFAESGTEGIRNRRADPAACPGARIDQSLPQGRLLLDRSCFVDPLNLANGQTRRNAYYGPGAWNFDLSIARAIRAPWLGDAGRITLRADVFNLFNHANLNNPESRLSCTAISTECAGAFGQALYGRREAASAFPAQRPFQETGRQIQLMLRIGF